MTLIPLITAIIGVGIHTLGLLDFIPHPSVLADTCMLLIDLLVAYGLIKKTRWGYYLALILFLQQSIMQPYWAYQKYISGFVILHPVELFIAPLLVISCFIILIFNKKILRKIVSEK